MNLAIKKRRLPNRIKRTLSLVVGCLLLSTNLTNRSRASSFVKDLLEQSRAKYAALKTYSDTGTVRTELVLPGNTDPATVETHTFTTFYRAPRQYFFEFKKDPNVGDERFVIWADNADFNSWWSATKVHDTYPKGHGDEAFALGAFPTKNAVMQLAPMLFAQAELHGPVVDLKVLSSEQIEQVNGHRCHKLVGEVGLAYGTGTVTNVRPTTIWIDAESMLLRKVLEDTPKGTSGIDRVTTTFDPQADVQIDDAHFKFSPPQ
jgi:outer membrane lipoprotein-sorting protein